MRAWPQFLRNAWRRLAARRGPPAAPEVCVSFWIRGRHGNQDRLVAQAHLPQTQIAAMAQALHRQIERKLEGRSARTEMDTPARSVAVRMLMLYLKDPARRTDESVNACLSALLLPHPQGIAAGDLFRAELAEDGIVTLVCERKGHTLEPEVVGRLPLTGAPRLH